MQFDWGIFDTATAMGPNPGPVEGLRREELLSMGLLSDASLIIEYLEFRRARSPRNLYTTDTLRTLKVVLCMLAEHTGFVWKNSAIFATHPHFQGKLPTSCETTGGRRQLRNPDQQWKEWCRVNHEKLDAVRRKLVKKKLIKRSRDPSEPIQAILDYRRPWELLFLMEKRMWREPMPISWSKRDLAAEFELRLLISFLIRYPFRIGTYERILVGDLRWVSQSLQLWLAPERFKNHHYLDDQTYKIEIDAALIPRINTYLEQHRPILHTDAPSEHLFPLPTNGSAGEPRRYFESKIAAGIRSFSQHYLHDYVPAGFHPQAVRDIIATHLILEDPIGGWARAAIALWDKIGTVHRHYAYLENVDFLRDHTASVTKLSSVFQSRP